MARRRPLRAYALVVLALAVVAGLMVVSADIIRIPALAALTARAPDQPVNFTHAHHVGELGIDCRHCHEGVEEEAHAGFPPMTTCAGCHYPIQTRPLVAPIEWTRVTRLPEHTYFHHGIHTSKGVACETCHGRVDQMERTKQPRDFTMRWCLECHRDPAPNLRPREDVTAMGWSPPANPEVVGQELAERHGVRDPGFLTHCYVCHR